jgi:pyruvate formate lyase activating enzyme
MTRQTAAQGTILEILRMSTEDGPGIRTTVFFKGCPLGCLWCHNPESINPKPQIQWVKTACIGCGICVEACPQKALSQTGEAIIMINRKICAGCGTCARECPSAAMPVAS